MKDVLRVLRNLVVVLLIMIGTAALTVWFFSIRDRRRKVGSLADKSPQPHEHVTANAASTSSAVPSPDGDLEWTRDEIRMLKSHIGNRTILALLELLRERDGKPVNYQELMERTGRTMPQVRADLAVFSRTVKKIEGHSLWPIGTTDPTDAESRIAYIAPKTYLDWWFED